MRLRGKLLILSPIALIVLVCVGPGLADDAPRGADLLVVVRDSAGSPVATRDVLLVEPVLHAQSDENGRVWFLGLEDGLRVHVSVTGSTSSSILLRAGEENRLEFVVSAGTSSEPGDRSR